jgi:hypothetical protein
VVTLGLMTTPVAAQSFNIDLGTTFGPPSTSFAGAAGQAGTWNSLGLGTSPLVGLAGSATGASVDVSSVSDTGNLPPGVTDNERLLGDNIFDCAAPKEWALTFSGLKDGFYQVFLYAPVNPLVSTGTGDANGVAFPDLPGNSSSLIEGQTWARLSTVVSGGVLVINGFEISTDLCAGLAGVQLVLQQASAPAPTMSMAGIGVLLSALTLVGARRLRHYS